MTMDYFRDERDAFRTQALIEILEAFKTMTALQQELLTEVKAIREVLNEHKDGSSK